MSFNFPNSLIFGTPLDDSLPGNLPEVSVALQTPSFVERVSITDDLAVLLPKLIVGNSFQDGSGLGKHGSTVGGKIAANGLSEGYDPGRKFLPGGTAGLTNGASEQADFLNLPRPLREPDTESTQGSPPFSRGGEAPITIDVVVLVILMVVAGFSNPTVGIMIVVVAVSRVIGVRLRCRLHIAPSPLYIG